MVCSRSSLFSEESIRSALVAAHDAIGGSDAALHGIGPLFSADGLSLNPLMRSIVEAAVDYRDCPLDLHVVLNAPAGRRQAIGAIQELGDTIGSVRGRTTFPCSMTIATVIGGAALVRSGDDWSGVAAAYQAIVDGVPKVATSTMATIESAYAQGVDDLTFPPTSLLGRGVRDGDGVLFIADNVVAALRAAFADADFRGFPRGRVPEVSFMA